MKHEILDAFALKSLPRTGWVRAGVESPESVAAHSWGVALLVLLLLPEDLDRERALTYAIVHDLAEAWVGDITPHDGISDKHARERAAMQTWCARIERPDLLAIWDAYEAQDDPESRFVKQLDRLDMDLEATRYEARGHDLSEFHASARSSLSDGQLRALAGLTETT